jgi:hypothetical protein
MRSDLLDVIAVISNPIKWKSRVRLFNDFVEHMRFSGVRLTAVECAHGDRPYQIGDISFANMVRVRTNAFGTWNKENLINIGMSRLPDDWRYLAWIDADIYFRQPDWAFETVDALQQYPVIQPWSDCYDLGPNGEHLEHHRSFARQAWHGEVKGIGLGYTFAHPGYAWAARRDALEELGGLIETGVAGAGDHHMACALIGRADWSYPNGVTEGYKAPILRWQERAKNVMKGPLGYLPGTIEHFWHGSKAKRRYVERWDIVNGHKYDPATDLRKNTNGVVELSGAKPAMIHDMDRYMRQRDEDGNEMA